MRNYISTPNIGLKRKITKQFETYDIDEYRTSMLYHRTQTITENLSYISKENNKTYELHAVLGKSKISLANVVCLTSTLKLLRNGCNSYTQQEIINRDKNKTQSVLNQNSLSFVRIVV